MANVHAEIVQSGRGCNLLLGGFALRKDRRYPDKQHWRCTVSGCPGRAHTDFGDPPSVFRSTPHNHMQDEEELTKKRVKHRVCVAAKDTPFVPLSQIYAEQVQQVSASSDVIPPAFVGCKSQMYRWRRQGMSAVSQRIADISLDGERGHTLADDPFVLHEDDKTVIFGTRENLEVQMSTAQVRLVKIKDVTGRSLYMSVTPDDGEGFHVMISDGVYSWSGAVDEEGLRSCYLKTKMDEDEFFRETRRALIDVNENEFQYSLEDIPDKLNMASFTWKKFIAADDITFKLGCMELMVQEEPADVIRRLLDGAVDNAQVLSSKIASLQDENARLMANWESALEKLTTCVKEKEALEADLFAKFVLVLNSKKARIRELMEELAETTKTSLAEAPIAATSGTALDRNPSENCQSNSDYDTDEEKKEVSATKRIRPSKVQMSADTDNSLNLGDDFPDDDETVVRKREPPRRKRPTTTTTKTTTVHEPKDRGGRKKGHPASSKQTTHSSRSSRSSRHSDMDVDDLLGEL